jgi:hypothetical protein
MISHSEKFETDSELALYEISDQELSEVVGGEVVIGTMVFLGAAKALAFYYKYSKVFAFAKMGISLIMSRRSQGTYPVPINWYRA